MLGTSSLYNTILCPVYLGLTLVWVCGYRCVVCTNGHTLALLDWYKNLLHVYISAGSP